MFHKRSSVLATPTYVRDYNLPSKNHLIAGRSHYDPDRPAVPISSRKWHPASTAALCVGPFEHLDIFTKRSRCRPVPLLDSTAVSVNG